MNKYYQIAIFSYFGALLFVIAGSMPTCLVFCFIGMFYGAKGIVKTTNQLFSLSLVFWLFSFMYGVSMPFNILIGAEIVSEVPLSIFTANIAAYVGCYCLACIGLLLSLITNRRRITNEDVTLNKFLIDCNSVKEFDRGATLTALLTSVFSVINTIRADGLILLFSGNKGLYQSAVSNLFLTMPSETTYYIFGMFAGLLIGTKDITNIKTGRYILKYTLLLLPFLATNLLLGMRGVLISALLTGTCCYAVFQPFKSISRKMIVIFFLSYIVMVFLYSYRGAVPFIAEDIDIFIQFIKDNPEKFWQNINPSASEFDSPAINFCVYFDKYGFTPDLKFGMTYLTGLAILIPAFLYPGAKPIQITYLFRDEFFPHYAEYSDIASTGFSSILEAYMNGGFVGICFVYYLLGKFLINLDCKTSKNPSITNVLVRAVVITSCMRCSRVALGGLFSEFFYGVVITLFIYKIVSIKTVKG